MIKKLKMNKNYISQVNSNNFKSIRESNNNPNKN